MRIFVDSNVLVYAKDSSEATKQERALAWVEHLWRNRSGRISIQVLEEYYVTVTSKLKPGIVANQARSDVRDLLAWRPLPVDHLLVEKAWAFEERFQLSFWDALIVSAAKLTDCEFLLTEDLQSGQDFDGLTIVNPFEVAPTEIFRPS
ncbi:MAG: PIN domain-containing protein [Actinomycetota bacterium]